LSLLYRVYTNDFAGGPVDYSTPAGETADPTFTLDVPAGSDLTAAVRTYDSVTGLEDDNVTVHVRLKTDVLGTDVTSQPAAPVGLTARPDGPGSVVLTWFQPTFGPAPAPDGWRVYSGPVSPDFSTVLATVVYHRGQEIYSARLTGLTPGSVLKFAARPFRGILTGPEGAWATARAGSAGPAAVDPGPAGVVASGSPRPLSYADAPPTV
jgi:hypothetical protein